MDNTHNPHHFLAAAAWAWLAFLTFAMGLPGGWLWVFFAGVQVIFGVHRRWATSHNKGSSRWPVDLGPDSL